MSILTNRDSNIAMRPQNMQRSTERLESELMAVIAACPEGVSDQKIAEAMNDVTMTIRHIRQLWSA
jgi:hypothetical protein